MLALVPRVVDALWAAFEPQLPEREESVHPLGCHRPRIADRDVFEAVLLRLVTGCSWDVAGRLGRGGETTLRTRYNEWNAHGAFDALVAEAIGAMTASLAWICPTRRWTRRCTRPLRWRRHGQKPC